MSSQFAATTWDLASWSTSWPVSLTMLSMLSVRIHPFTPTFSASWRSESYCIVSKCSMKLPSCLQVMRLFRLGRVARQIQRFLESSFHLLILMMGFYLIVCHWFACAWWGSGSSAWKSSIRRFVITEKAATIAFTFKTLLRHYAEQALTPR